MYLLCHKIEMVHKAIWTTNALQEMELTLAEPNRKSALKINLAVVKVNVKKKFLH
jgi:hypothetical protein